MPAATCELIPAVTVPPNTKEPSANASVCSATASNGAAQSLDQWEIVTQTCVNSLVDSIHPEGPQPPSNEVSALLVTSIRRRAKPLDQPPNQETDVEAKLEGSEATSDSAVGPPQSPASTIQPLATPSIEISPVSLLTVDEITSFRDRMKGKVARAEVKLAHASTGEVRIYIFLLRGSSTLTTSQLRDEWHKKLRFRRAKLDKYELALSRRTDLNSNTSVPAPSSGDENISTTSDLAPALAPIPPLAADPPAQSPAAAPTPNAPVPDPLMSEGEINAYEDAVAYMTEYVNCEPPVCAIELYAQFLGPLRYMASPPKEPTTSERLQTAQALLLELGVFSRPEDLPRSVTAARKIFFEVVHLNILDYYSLRSQGMGALRSAMHDTKTALRADLRKRRAALQEVKALGLRDLLAPRGGA